MTASCSRTRCRSGVSGTLGIAASASRLNAAPSAAPLLAATTLLTLASTMPLPGRGALAPNAPDERLEPAATGCRIEHERNGWFPFAGPCC